ncbi:MAG: ATP phosphoribosyltransferase regulatory subunit [Campylobacterota bacterium]|nr:ATP phosphoribosyltransferase regulatory subunit [Campylobacterota bacterium]
MIFEHEIPEGSKLYFAESAALKRKIEHVASDALSSNGFLEIATPLFSYHQHHSIADDRQLIRINDDSNHSMSLRADSTIDVVRILGKRLDRNTAHKKWFYIQPVFRYPAIEQYQVGAEYIDEADLSKVLNVSLAVFNTLEMQPLLQLSNINIPKKLVEMFDIELDDFRHINIERLLSLDIEWLTKLVYLQHIEQIDEVIALVPQEIKEELLKIKEISSKVDYSNIVIAPLYYAEMLYYDELFFRIIENNDVYASGGRYSNEEVTSVGFAIYVDEVLEAKMKKGEK